MDIKDTAQRIFEEIQINKDIKKGFDGLTPQQRYNRSVKGKIARERYESTEQAKLLKKARQKAYYERKKLLKTQSENP